MEQISKKFSLPAHKAGAGLVLLVAAIIVVLWRVGQPSPAPVPGSAFAALIDRGLDSAGKAELELRIQTLEAAMREDTEASEDISNMLQLGNLKYAYGDLAGAKEWYERILADHPRDAPALENLGQALYEMGDVTGAEARWRAAIVVNSYEPTYLKLADLIDERLPEKRSEIGHILEEAIATLGQTPGLLARLGAWYEAQGLYAQALSHYEIALQLDPDDAALKVRIDEVRQAMQRAQMFSS
ncbi:tetratricopeptide repeat protein [Candidatus Uhrbacteria bacterium]|nr:tetratricopeptide repeat protein [Candidatus Uhrbacteria bacterium]